ncbi:uncharacterized protein LOC122008565 isoform X1 [Zingiber officinale]|uniref:DUF3741 domain-containing protein n=1 Tax=Zingiber officinale TaxID=94328 RepID=A0A8J5FG06_ZINOF|nr:uncharacterized protein LOC122008565 isoform X1 [Zingiber officinale]KAG6484723.1 hypothetical protein ZIOFF_053246 [Zingiber officinale]
MTYGVAGRGCSEEQSLEPQFGCMAGLRQLFDRHSVLAGRRQCPNHRLPSTTTSESEGSYYSTSALSFKERHPMPSSPEPCSPSTRSLPTAETPAQRYIPVFGFKEGGRLTWRFRDSPRLSLDSRALFDAKSEHRRLREVRTVIPVASGSQSGVYTEVEEQRPSPSVVARLMGINALPSADSAEHGRCLLRRSASESGVRRDPSRYRSLYPSSFITPEDDPISAEGFFKAVDQDPFTFTGAKKLDPTRNTQIVPLHLNRFLYEDFFRETKRSGVLYGEIERKLKMRGIDEPAKDLETLKQILEALQLQGLLRSNPANHRTNSRRILTHDFEDQLQCDSPIVKIKKVPKAPREFSLAPPPRSSRSTGTGRRDGTVGQRGVNRRSDMLIRTPPRSPVNRRPSSAASHPQRTISAVGSTKSNPKRAVPDPPAAGSPTNCIHKAAARNKNRVLKPAEDDTATTIHGSSTGSCHPPFGMESMQRPIGIKPEFRREKAWQVYYVSDQRPSPISVLDSSPSPLTNRCIDFKDQSAEELEEHCAAAAVRTGDGNCMGSPGADVRDGVLPDSLRLSDAGEKTACGALQKCIADGGATPASEISNAALQIERLIFRDLVGETIRHLASAASDSRRLNPRRKLAF